MLRDGVAGLPLDAPTARRIRDELLAGRPFRGRIPADVQSGPTLYFRAEPASGPEGPILVGVVQEVDDTRAGDEGAAEVARSPTLAQLRWLDLAACRIGDRGAMELARSPYLKHLERLSLGGNRIGEGGRAHAALKERFGERVAV